MSNYAIEFSVSVEVFDEKQECYKEVLHSIAAQIPTGQMTAIMGPSGSGKTTLLTCLASTVSEIKGWLNIQGKKANKQLQKQIGYVLQEDLFLSELTLKETLMFMALVKMDRRISFLAKKSRVEEIISLLNLNSCSNTLIGNISARGLSGGEKKRASIASELLANPSILLLDEPTSGLDSHHALKLVLLLKELSVKRNMTVIASIHQPTSEIFNSFDLLLALSEGYNVYCGPTKGLVPHMASSGLPCPPYYNPADHLMNVSVDPVSSQKLIDYAKANFLKIERPTHNAKEITYAEKELNSDNKDLSVKYANNWMTQFIALSWRTYRCSAGFIITKAQVTQTILISLAISSAFFRMPHTEDYINNRFGILNFSMVFLFFVSCFMNLLIIPQERGVVNKDRASGLYHVSAYYFSKIVAEIPVQYVLPSILFNVIYWLSGLQYLITDWPNYFALWLLVLLFVTSGSSFGLATSTFFLNLINSIIFLTTVALTWLMFSGYYARFFPSWLAWFVYLSPLNYGYDASLQLVFTDTMIVTCSVNGTSQFQVCNSGQRDFVSGTEVLKFADIMIEFPLWANILGLIGFTIIFRFLAYIFIRYFNRPSGRIVKINQKLRYFYRKIRMNLIAFFFKCKKPSRKLVYNLAV